MMDNYKNGLINLTPELLDGMPAGMIIYDASNRIIRMNRRALESLGYESWEKFQDLTGGTMDALISVEERRRIDHLFTEDADPGDNYYFMPVTLLDRENRKHSFLCTVENIRQDGQPLRCMILLDRSVQQQIYEIDQLTGLPGRNEFLKYADSRIHRNEDQPFAYLYFSLINFKNINLSYGTSNGDKALQTLADVLLEVFPDELIARFNADHFVLQVIDDNLEARIQQLHSLATDRMADFRLTVKTGIYRMEGMQDPADCCEKAKAAADSIRNIPSQYYAFYTKKLEETLLRQQYVSDHIDEAVEKGWIQAYYQPVIRTISGALCGMEALARWIDPAYGFLSPGDFIPVLEQSHQTYKLDTCMIELVCRNYNECMQKKIPVVPVSFNLSRGDFFDCDIFSVVEEMLRKYDVPRDMIHIEITESMFVHDALRISKEIERFHAAGYQVWMDDFGSCYSSLNILKDYDFDELKIDMKFLSAFTQKSRSIITSTVSMSKHIGTQTLAEGVETKEQYEFLKKIGCEKVQGYLFGKPEPYGESLQAILDKNLKVETRSWKSYFDAVSHVDFITGKSLAIVEDNGRKFDFRFINDAFMSTLSKISDKGIIEVEEGINSPLTPLAKTLRQTADGNKDDHDRHYFIIPVRNDYLRVTYNVISRLDRHAMYAVEIENITNSSTHKKQETLDSILHNLYYLYDSVYMVDYENEEIRMLIGSGGSEILKNGKTILECRYMTADLIYPEDRELYLRFTDAGTIDERILKNGKGYVTEYFRTRMPDGSYHWKSHIISNVTERRHVYLYCVRPAAIDEPRIAQELMHHYGESGNEKDILFPTANGSIALSEAEMWENLLRSTNIHYFWKDTQRRFVGASRSFLDYYGLASVDDILGKTDEDMNWHVNNDPYRNDEYAVLRGARVINVPGKCIIRGVVHNIAASKYPIYKDGKIVGLIGNFVDVDSTQGRGNDLGSYIVTDTVTHLSNARGIMDTWISYTEDYKLRGNSFAAFFISVPDIRRIRDTYGGDTADALITQIATVISRRIANRGSAGRLYGAEFVVFYRYGDRTEVETLADDISADIADIHRIGTNSITIFPEVKVVYSSDEAFRSIEELSGSDEISSHDRRELQAYKVFMNPQGGSSESSSEPDIKARMKELSTIFDTVRLVDPTKERVLVFRDNGDIAESDMICSSIWHRTTRCVNCISMTALKTRSTQCKYEFIGDDAYFVVSQYVVVHGQPCVMECVMKLDHIILSAFGKTRFHKIMEDYDRKYYSTPVDACHNRLYYDEVVHSLYCSAIAFLRINDLTGITTMYGYACSVELLQKTARIINASLRSTDTAIHYENDLFLVVFNDMASLEAMHTKLQTIRSRVEAIQSATAKDVHITVSIGGVMADAPVDSLIEKADNALELAEKSGTGISVTDLTD